MLMMLNQANMSLATHIDLHGFKTTTHMRIYIRLLINELCT